jgi:hypothetical protein
MANFYIETRAASGILQRSPAQVHGLIKKGRLRDYGVNGTPSGRHNYRLDIEEVKALAVKLEREAQETAARKAARAAKVAARVKAPQPVQATLLATTPNGIGPIASKVIVELHVKMDRLTEKVDGLTAALDALLKQLQ